MEEMVRRYDVLRHACREQTLVATKCSNQDILREIETEELEDRLR